MNVQTYTESDMFVKAERHSGENVRSHGRSMSWLSQLALTLLCLPACDWFASDGMKNSASYISPAASGPKFPRYAGTKATGEAVEPTLLRVDRDNCPLQCSDCVVKMADKILIVAGSSKGHEDKNALAVEQARRRAASVCGAENVLTLSQPSKAELQLVISQLRDSLTSWIFVGHGYSDGILLHDTVPGAEYLVAPNRTNLLEPAELGDYLDGAALPSLGMFSCDQGGETAKEWARATMASKILVFDGPADIDDIVDTHVEHFVESISCTKKKWLCRP